MKIEYEPRGWPETVITGLAGTPRVDKSFGEDGRFGKKGGLPGAKGRLGDPLFDRMCGPGVDARGNLIVSKRGAAYELSMPQCTGTATTIVTWNSGDKAWLPAPIVSAHWERTVLSRAGQGPGAFVSVGTIVHMTPHFHRRWLTLALLFTALVPLHAQNKAPVTIAIVKPDGGRFRRDCPVPSDSHAQLVRPGRHLQK